MNDRRYLVRQLSGYLIAGLSFIALVMILTFNLLNVTQAGAQAEKAALIEVPQHRR